MQIVDENKYILELFFLRQALGWRVTSYPTALALGIKCQVIVFFSKDKDNYVGMYISIAAITSLIYSSFLLLMSIQGGD